jgi:hypothetical protein
MVERIFSQEHRSVWGPTKPLSTANMSKETIHSSDEKVWSDVEKNTLVVSDDDALMRATGKVGELKRYGGLPNILKILADD